MDLTGEMSRFDLLRQRAPVKCLEYSAELNLAASSSSLNNGPLPEQTAEAQSASTQRPRKAALVISHSPHENRESRTGFHVQICVTSSDDNLKGKRLIGRPSVQDMALLLSWHSPIRAEVPGRLSVPSYRPAGCWSTMRERSNTKARVDGTRCCVS